MTSFWSSKILYTFGVHDLTIRYSLSFLLAYATFFGLVRLWLWYVFSTRTKASEDSWSFLDFDLWFLGSSNTQSAPSWKGQGGEFSGGGASSSFDGPDTSVSLPKSKSFDLDLDMDGEAAPLIVAILVIGFVLVLLGSAFYFIFNAPMILGEIAFELALGVGILKSKNRKTHPFEWLQTALKKTWLFAFGLLLLIVITTLTIKHFNPEITKSSELKTWIMNYESNKKINPSLLDQ